MTIQQDATVILVELAKHPESEYVENQALANAVNMSPDRVSTAVSILEDNGYVKVLRALGNAPFNFGNAFITPQGRLALEQAQAAAEAKASETGDSSVAQIRPMPQPVGSPYGFTPQDFEYIIGEQQSNRLIVVFGYQWESTHYDAGRLSSALQDEFERALARTSAKDALTLDFVRLRAGYGEHVFNQIARSIIASDIAIFETSDANPNVMIEMGVALTWGTRVHPIREESRPEPPSDISGQTWACYRDSGAEWVDPRHFDAVVLMVELAARKKLSRL